MTPLVLPPKVRAIAYAIISIAGLVVGAAQVGFAALERGNPDWLVVALAVVPFVTSGIGAVALTHTPKADEVEYVGEHRAPEPQVVELGAESAATVEERLGQIRP